MLNGVWYMGVVRQSGHYEFSHTHCATLTLICVYSSECRYVVWKVAVVNLHRGGKASVQQHVCVYIYIYVYIYH